MTPMCDDVIKSYILHILDSPLNRENLGIKFFISVKLDIDVGLENAKKGHFKTKKCQF